MPDCHALVADLNQAKKEFLIRFKLSMNILENGLELSKDNDFELAIRVTKEFYLKNKDFKIEEYSSQFQDVLIVCRN